MNKSSLKFNSGKMWKLVSKITDNNYETNNSFNYRVQKIKFKYETSADNKNFFYCNAG